MGIFTHYLIDTISQEERDFFKDLGLRIAQLRKEQRLTQQLGTAQQQVASYVTARLRVPASLPPRLARVLGVSLEALIGEISPPAKRGPTPKLQRHMERISQLPKPKQRFVMEMLDTVLAQASR